MEEEKEKGIEEDELMGDPLDLMTKAIKVHTKGIDLNEDTTLSNLDSELSRKAKYVMEQVAIAGILRSFFKQDCIIIRYSNKMDEWGTTIEYKDPERKHFEKSKDILLNKVYSLQLLSRGVKGRPLKAFLTYGKGNEGLEEKEKMGLIDKMMGKNKKKEEDEYE